MGNWSMKKRRQGVTHTSKQADATKLGCPRGAVAPAAPGYLCPGGRAVPAITGPRDGGEVGRGRTVEGWGGLETETGLACGSLSWQGGWTRVCDSG